MQGQAAREWTHAWSVPADHPAFEGHFPGQPILPGVAVLAQVLEVAGTQVDDGWRREPVDASTVKFLAPLRPADACVIVLKVDAASADANPKLRFEVRRGSELAASGVLARRSAGTIVPAPATVQAPAALTAEAPALGSLASSVTASPPASAPSTKSSVKPPADATPAEPAAAASAEWARAPERSNATVLRLMAWIAVKGGRTMARWLLVPISLYYLLFSPNHARQSRRFLKRALGRDANWIDGYRHIHTFASTILDRVYFLRQGVTPFDIDVKGHAELNQAAHDDPGAFLVGGHLGSFEVMRAVGDRIGGLKVAMVMYPGNAQKINDTLRALDPDRPVPIIALGRMESMLAVRDWLDQGGLAGMLGDRSLEAQHQAGRVVRVPFLGREVDFVDGPMRLAALLKRRVYFMAGLYRGGNRYDVSFKPLVDFRQVGPSAREAAIREAVVAYVRELEAHALDAPYNWFNFHDFWLEDSQPIAPPAR